MKQGQGRGILPPLVGFGFLNAHVKILSLLADIRTSHAEVPLRDFLFKICHIFKKTHRRIFFFVIIIGACAEGNLTVSKPNIPLPQLRNLDNHFSFLHFFQMMSSEHLTCGWLQRLLAVLLKLCLTFAGPLRPVTGTACTAKGPASYILVFTGHWSPQAFPKQYPLFRPPAQWSKLIGKRHLKGQRHWLREKQPFLMENFTSNT